jgi:hypothetical protein
MGRGHFQFRLWMIFALMALIGWGLVAVPYWLYEFPMEQSLRKSPDYRLFPPRVSVEREKFFEVVRTRFGRVSGIALVVASFLVGMRAERWLAIRRERRKA